jgi:effector-binding domain-containing protein/uncharacterized protein YndB with AHSA1/START domain
VIPRARMRPPRRRRRAAVNDFNNPLQQVNIIRKIAIGAVSLVALFVGVGLLLPRTAHVQRSLTIEAPAATVFTVLNGFRQFDRWSPWAGIDPAATTTFEGPPTGVGAKMAWAGNDDVGTGTQEIVESTPHSDIRVRLTFGDFPGNYEARYTLAPAGEGTAVTWSFAADYGGSLVGRYFGLLSESMVGADYEKGLAQLKALVEAMPKADFANLPIEIVETLPAPLIMTATSSAADPRATGVSLGVAYGRLSGFMSAHGLRQAGPPLAIFHGERDGTLRFDAAIPVDRVDAPAADAIRAGRTHAGRAARAIHRGAYRELRATHEQLRAWLAASGLREAGPPWEQYVSDPASVPEGELITHVYYPIE